MPEAADDYRPEDIEPRVQALWEQQDVFRTRDDAKEPNEKRVYCLDMFPYPSGEGLHVGHVEGYTATDIYSRYLRMHGFDVLHPMGWDAFGLPAENAAIKQKTHPRKLVEKNVQRFTEQLKRLGFSYDWSREINTTDPEYYTWTQWIFLKLFHLGLAYEADVPIHWCPKDKTGLANEEVIDGKCERCGTPVEKRNLRQWMLRITKYADRLLRDLDQLDWPEGIKELQRNWIGRSEGAELEFLLRGVPGQEDGKHKVKVFTTRPDTLFGATCIAISAELAREWMNIGWKADDTVKTFIEKTLAENAKRSVEDVPARDGIFAGMTAENPVNNERIPVWVANYVLSGYGTGALMAVPAHDERDFEFARKFDLPIREVIRPEGKEAHGEPTEAFVGEGILVNSGEFTGLPSAEAREKITAWLEEHGLGKRSVQYKLRDWVFSRQRYWGEPIPIVHCETCGVVPVPEEQLPVLLPDVESYEPTGTGESPLAVITDWVNTTCPKCEKPAKRETNTMPQWAGSCWYFLRFCDPHNTKEPWSWEALERWMPVDLYVGGAEHAVLHLLYARFWMKALYDGGYMPLEEPFQKLRNQGIVLGPDGQKMSKSRGNVVNPDEIVAEYGADTLRLYEMFLGPLEMGKPWNPRAILGVHRFLKRVWLVGRVAATMKSEGKDRNKKTGDVVQKALHRLIRKVGDDIEALKFNTAIAALMDFANLMIQEGIAEKELRQFLVVLSPFAPHIAEELWRRFDDKSLVFQQSWPEFRSEFLEEDTVQIVVQVNGKVRDQLTMPRDASEEDVRAAAERGEQVQKWLSGKSIANVVVVKNRLINFVTK